MKKLLMLFLIIGIFASCHKNKVKVDLSPTVDTALVSTDTVAVDTATVAEPELFSGDHKYYVVVGAFKAEWRSKKWAAKIDSLGYTPEVVLSHNDFYMVYVKGVDDKKQALIIMEHIRECTCSRSWVYVKR